MVAVEVRNIADLRDVARDFPGAAAAQEHEQDRHPRGRPVRSILAGDKDTIPLHQQAANPVCDLENCFPGPLAFHNSGTIIGTQVANPAVPNYGGVPGCGQNIVDPIFHKATEIAAGLDAPEPQLSSGAEREDQMHRVPDRLARAAGAKHSQCLV
jgi:hypothetical protein